MDRHANFKLIEDIVNSFEHNAYGFLYNMTELLPFILLIINHWAPPKDNFDIALVNRIWRHQKAFIIFPQPEGESILLGPTIA